MDNLPFVKKWLAQGERVRKIVAERYGHLDENASMLAAVEENVLVQIENLREFPNIAQAPRERRAAPERVGLRDCERRRVRVRPQHRPVRSDGGRVDSAAPPKV